MVAQLVEDLVHLEGREDGFDQHGGADGAAGNAEVVLRKTEDVVPQPRFQMAFHLRQVEIWAGASADQFLRVVKEVQSEIEQRAGDGLAIHQEMSLIQMPAARAHQQRRDLSHSARSACPPD